MERLRDAQNAHDLDALDACVAPDYRSEQPRHPGRAFVGSPQVRRNWTGMFEAIPDFRAELLTCVESGDEAWSEWRWTGTRADGGRFEWRGVTIFGLRDGRIAWGRLYMDEVDPA